MIFSTKKRRDIKCILSKFAHIENFVQEIVESPPGPRIFRSFASSLVEAIICQTKHQVCPSFAKPNIRYAHHLPNQTSGMPIICQTKHQVCPSFAKPNIRYSQHLPNQTSGTVKALCSVKGPKFDQCRLYLQKELSICKEAVFDQC